MLHVIHCIQSGCILPGCMESTAFNHAAWNPLYSIRMHFNKLHGIHSVITLHGLRCIQSGSITPQCMESSAFNHAAWNPLHSIGMHFTMLHESTAFSDAAWNALLSIGMLWAMLHKIHCNQSGCTRPRCMDSTAFNWYPLRCNAWNPLHSKTLHGIHCIQSG